MEQTFPFFLWNSIRRIFQINSTMKTKIPDTKKYRREGSKTLNRAVFRSTLVPPDKTLLKGTRLPELADELLGILNQ